MGGGPTEWLQGVRNSLVESFNMSKNILKQPNDTFIVENSKLRTPLHKCAYVFTKACTCTRMFFAILFEIVNKQK